MDFAAFIKKKEAIDKEKDGGNLATICEPGAADMKSNYCEPIDNEVTNQASDNLEEDSTSSSTEEDSEDSEDSEDVAEATSSLNVKTTSQDSDPLPGADLDAFHEYLVRKYSGQETPGQLGLTEGFFAVTRQVLGPFLASEEIDNVSTPINSISAQEAREENRCQKCGAGFMSPSNLRRHTEGVHLKNKYPCPQCHEAFGRYDQRKRHIYIHHEQGVYKCKICQLQVTSEVGLKAHEKRHANPKYRRGTSSK